MCGRLLQLIAACICNRVHGGINPKRGEIMGINESLLTYEQQSEEIERLRSILNGENVSYLHDADGVYKAAKNLVIAIRNDPRSYLAESWCMAFDDMTLTVTKKP